MSVVVFEGEMSPFVYNEGIAWGSFHGNNMSCVSWRQGPFKEVLIFSRLTSVSQGDTLVRFCVGPRSGGKESKDLC